jgi:hypothetical protein
MTDYGDVASANIREYIWHNILDLGVLKESNYYADGMPSALVPIIPSQQIPEFNNLLPGRTYLVYDHELKTVPVQWWMFEETMNLTILSQNYDKIVQISSMLNDLFRRYDDSAKDINNYFQNNNSFQFHHTVVDSVLSPEPFSTEGDLQTGVVTISYSYSRKTGSDGRF